jgi:hypothetical protein
MGAILVFVYAFISVWAANKTIYANYAFFGSPMQVFIKKMVPAMLLGPILIPVAIIKMIMGK